jgi:hypothetical protein
LDGTTGKTLRNSVVAVSAAGAVTGAASLALKGTTNAVALAVPEYL